MDLSGGIISKILVDAAGSNLQEECTRKAPIAPGQVVITGSGNIKCKYIFHIALNNYDRPGGSAEKVIVAVLSSSCIMQYLINVCHMSNFILVCIKHVTIQHIINVLFILDTQRINGQVPK